MYIKYINSKYVNAREAENQIGHITQKQVLALYDCKPLIDITKLYKGMFDTVGLTMTGPKKIRAVYSIDGKLGFSQRDYWFSTLQTIRNEWINSPILNRSGLATLIWDDLTPNNLRRRLEQRVQYLTFSETEKEIIIREVEKFLSDIKKSFEM